MRTNCIFTYALVGAAALFLGGRPAAACLEIWEPYTPISSPTITQPTPSNTCAGINGDVDFTCSACTDTDKKTLDGTVSYPADTVFYYWTADGGSFPNGYIGQGVKWTAPSTPGNYTVTVTVDDVDNRAMSGGGSDDDSPKSASLIMHVEAFADVWSTCTRSSLDETRYSGTGCTIGGYWYAGAGHHLTEVKLWVNDICRYRYTWSGSEGPNEWWWDDVPFSSTQFNHNSEMTLKARCWTAECPDAPGTGYEYKIAWNRGYVLYDGSMTWGSETAGWADSSLVAMNHGSSGKISTHHAQDIINNIPNYGVLYTYGHGNVYNFNDCFNTGSVYTQDVSDAVSQKGAGQCPYVFVFLDACLCGSTDAFWTSFGASAVLGWIGTTPGEATYSAWSRWFWYKIKGSGETSETIQTARDYATSAWPGATGSVCYGNSDLCLHKTYPPQCPP